MNNYIHLKMIELTNELARYKEADPVKFLALLKELHAATKELNEEVKKIASKK